MIFNPYHIYRAWKADKRLYFVWSGLKMRLTFGSSMKQVLARFSKSLKFSKGWKARCLFDHQESGVQ